MSSIIGSVAGFAAGWYYLAPMLGYSAGGASGDVAKFLISASFAPAGAGIVKALGSQDRKVAALPLIGAVVSFGTMYLLSGPINSYIQTDWLAALVLLASSTLTWVLIVGGAIESLLPPSN